MLRDRCNYFSFWAIFCPFAPKKWNLPKLAQKWKFQKNEKKKKKKHLEISSFYTSVTELMIICYTVPEIWHMTDVIVIFHFGLFLPFYPPKSTWRYHHFTHVYQKLWLNDVQLPRNGVWQTDGQTDRRMDRKSDT